MGIYSCGRPNTGKYEKKKKKKYFHHILIGLIERLFLPVLEWTKTHTQTQWPLTSLRRKDVKTYMPQFGDDTQL